MNIECNGVSPLERAIEPELLFLFEVSDLGLFHVPSQIDGELFSEAGFKIGNLTGWNENSYRLSLNADGATRTENNYPFQFSLGCVLTPKAIQHIENFRLERKERSKDIVLRIQLNITMLEGNLQISHFYTGEQPTGQNNRVPLSYQYNKSYSSDKTNLWVVSGNGNSKVLTLNRYRNGSIMTKIDLMDWNNRFAEYLGIGESLIFEFLQPEQMSGYGNLMPRYEKAQRAVAEMKTQLLYGEWKTAIISSRAVFELFKRFEDFHELLIDAGYSEAAYEDLKSSIDAFFNYISKFHHSLAKNNKDLNDEIATYKEDAYMVYSYSVSILYLISQKIKRM